MPRRKTAERPPSTRSNELSANRSRRIHLPACKRGKAKHFLRGNCLSNSQTTPSNPTTISSIIAARLGPRDRGRQLGGLEGVPASIHGRDATPTKVGFGNHIWLRQIIRTGRLLAALRQEVSTSKPAGCLRPERRYEKSQFCNKHRQVRRSTRLNHRAHLGSVRE
jgi:hypothetical protein